MIGRPRLDLTGYAILSWGALGLALLLAKPLFYLTPIALEPVLAGTLSPGQWILYAAWVVANAYAEGIRGFQRSLSPRAVSRAFHLARHPRPLRIVLAPLYALSLFGATAKGLRVAWSITLGVLLLVLTVRMLPQPWRGIVDGGVVVGLGWGVLSLLWHYSRALVRDPGPPPDLPEPERVSA